MSYYHPDIPQYAEFQILLPDRRIDATIDGGRQRFIFPQAGINASAATSVNGHFIVAR